MKSPEITAHVNGVFYESTTSTDDKKRSSVASVVWAAAIVLSAMGVAVAVLRAYRLLSPGHRVGFDHGFYDYRVLTFFHIIPAALLIVLMPLQFVARLRPRWHRWSGRILLALGFVVGITALIMTYTMAIGGANEIAVITLYATLFLIFLALGFRNIRRGRVARHREWMIRAFGVALGIAVTRPIVGAFFAARRMAPQEFFGIAFWLGFTITLLGAEAWIHYTEHTT
jgi:hypothetical protein